MSSIECKCECERSPSDTGKPPAQAQHITTDVDLEITRHRLKALLKRLEEWEADLAPNDVIYGNIDGLFDENGDLKYFKNLVLTDEDLSNEFHIPTPQVKWFLEQAYPNFCYEERAFRRQWNMHNALSRLGYAYQKQKRQFAELNDSYDALKAHAKDAKADLWLNDGDCPKCKELRNELMKEQIRTANFMLRASNLERRVNELLEELKEAKTELEVAGKASFWDKVFPTCIVCGLSIAFVAAVVSLIFS